MTNSVIKQSADKWIDYKKHLPPLNTWVFAAGVEDGEPFFNRDRMILSYIGITDEGKHVNILEWENMGRYTGRHVTHWMLAFDLPTAFPIPGFPAPVASDVSQDPSKA